MGAEGFVQAQKKNDKVLPLVTTSGPDGDLDGAKYFSRIAVPADELSSYADSSDATGYSIKNIKGKRMGYVAVSGGREAIDASLDLLERRRVSSGRSIDVDLIAQVLPELVEQVQSEGSLWCPEVAATAVKQARGSVEEAVFLVRAYRSTLERLYVSRTIDTNDMGMDFARPENLNPTRPFAHRAAFAAAIGARDIDFDRRLGEREIGRTKADFPLFAKHLFHEEFQGPFEIG